MTVSTGSKAAERGALYLPCDVGPAASSVHWTLRVRTAVLIVGLALGAAGVSLGLAVVWTQLARALPLANLLHHPRAGRAITLVGAGLALMLLGRRRSPTNLPGIVRVAIAALLVTAGAPPALAVDATGTWSGTWSCRQREAGTTVARTRRAASTMLITQNGETVFIEIDGTDYHGLSHDSARNPRRAGGSAMRSMDDGEALTFTIRVNDVRGTAKLRGKSTVPNDPGGSHCSYRFSRMSLADPHLGPSAEESRPCDPLDVSGHWEGTWGSDVTGASGQIVANLSQEGEFLFGTMSFPPFGHQGYSPSFLRISSCAPAEFTTGVFFGSGVVGTLYGMATNTWLAGGWAMSDGSDHGTWLLSR